MTSQEQARVQEAKARVQQSYPWLQSGEIDWAYNIALWDFIVFRYPSENGRPTEQTLVYDYFTVNRIETRMIDILSRSGGINVTAYKENGLDKKYGARYGDPNWIASLGLPKAGVPR